MFHYSSNSSFITFSLTLFLTPSALISLGLILFCWLSIRSEFVLVVLSLSSCLAGIFLQLWLSKKNSREIKNIPSKKFFRNLAITAGSIGLCLTLIDLTNGHWLLIPVYSLFLLTAALEINSPFLVISGALAWLGSPTNLYYQHESIDLALPLLWLSLFVISQKIKETNHLHLIWLSHWFSRTTQWMIVIVLLVIAITDATLFFFEISDLIKFPLLFAILIIFLKSSKPLIAHHKASNPPPTHNATS